MHFEENTLEVLRALGLTHYGARAYYALTAMGPSGAAALAEETGIPRSKIYEVLGRLVREGWATATDTRPLRYRPRDPREVLAARRESITAKVDGASRELSGMFDRAVEREPPNAWMVRGEENIVARVSDLMRRAREEVLFLGALYLPGELDALDRLVPEARKRGVKVRALVRESIATDRGEIILARRLASLTLEVKVMYTPVIKFVIADQREIMIMFSLVTGEVADLTNALAIWMPRTEVAALMRSNFMLMWNSERLGLEQHALLSGLGQLHDQDPQR